MEARFMTTGMISAKSCPMYIKLTHQQAKRRRDILEIQKQRRNDQITERRNLVNDKITKRRNFKNDEDVMEIDMKINVIVPNNEESELSTSMMKSEWMFEKPEDIDDWIAVLCPEGKRCCVIAQDNKTKSVNKFGTSIKFFQSLLPYGCSLPNNHPSHRKRTVLDCVYSYKLRTFYILDIIEWMGVPYTDFDAEFRFYFIQSKLSEIPGINEKSTTNSYPFELAPRMVTRDLYLFVLEKYQFFPGNVELDGINFYHPHGLYTPGETPLVLWLKPFMIPEILQSPVNDHLAQLNKPTDYVNIIEYSRNFNVKKKYKKKKNAVTCDKMEMDNSPEVEVVVQDTITENEMCMET